MQELLEKEPEEIVTREIPPTEWREFLDGYSRAHDGWIGTVDVRSPYQHYAPVYVDQRFGGAYLERHREGDVIMLRMGSGCATHLVKNVRSIVVEETAGGSHVGLTLYGESENAARLRFRAAARPELLDGLPR